MERGEEGMRRGGGGALEEGEEGMRREGERVKQVDIHEMIHSRESIE